MVIQTILSLVVMLALFFIPAGRLDWWEGWALLIAFTISVSALVIWVSRKDPELMAERRRSTREGKRWDQVIIAVYTILLCFMIILAGLDSGRYEWTSPPLYLRLLGWIGAGLAMILGFWVFTVNTYLSGTVRIQDDRGHQVVSEGPYQYVRHPMYACVIVLVLCVPLILGSFWALIPAVLIAILFVIRTALEDLTLQKELNGYEEYTEQVRYRLIPGVW
jgi:protein-S-isoprenylcysteine O-methyltransferase Ste14